MSYFILVFSIEAYSPIIMDKSRLETFGDLCPISFDQFGKSPKAFLFVSDGTGPGRELLWLEVTLYKYLVTITL